jgi:hypothetical protein
LLDHKGGRVALAAANSILDRAFGKPAQSVQAQVTTVDIGKMWMEAAKLLSAQENAPKVIEAEATHIVNGKVTPISPLQCRPETTAAKPPPENDW